MLSKKRLLNDTFSIWLIKHLWRYKFIYVAALISLFLLHFIQAKLPTLILEIAPLFKTHDFGHYDQLKIIILKFLLMALGIIIFRTLSRWMFFYPARLQQSQIRMELIDRLSRANPSWQNRISSGELMQILTADIDSLRAFVGFALLQIFNIIFALSVILPLLFNLTPVLLYSIVPLLFCFCIFSFSIKYSSRLTTQGKVFRDELQQILIETYDAKKTLNTFNKEESSVDLFTKKSEEEILCFQKANIIRSFARPLLTLGVSLSIVTAAWIVFKFHLKMEYLVITSTYLFLLQEPITLISWISILFTDTKISWARIKSMLIVVEGASEENSSTDLSIKSLNVMNNEKLEVEIQLFKKNHQDIETKLSPKQIDFNLERINTKILICGSTGSGKTTLLNAIAEKFRKNGVSFGLVNQSSILFNDSLINNILLGEELNEELTKRILLLLDIFQLTDLSKDKNDIFQLQIGENGKRLSGGQVKRICLLRCFVHNYEFLLWDDPFSSVDILLEKEIWERLVLDKFWNGTKLIFTSQRITALKYATEVFFMDQVNESSLNGFPIEKLKSFSWDSRRGDEEIVRKIHKFYEKQIISHV